jgi:predicted dehydrogenase
MSLLRPCKVVIIGAGYTAREHIRAFADVPGVIIAGIHSRTRSRAEALAREFSIPLVCDSIVELYEKTKADLVVVTVVELSMRAVSVACFEYPWTILLEKPAGYNIADAQSIKDAARKRKSKVFVALNRRFYASTQMVRNDVNCLDAKRFIKVQDQQDQKAALAAGQPQLVVDNWMYANSIHLVDYFRVLGRGKVTQVEPVHSWDPQCPGPVISRIVFDSGDVGLYEGIWDGPGPWAVTVSTPLKRWELRPLEQAGIQNRGERKIQLLEQHAWDQKFKPGFRLQAQEAVAAAFGDPTQAITLADAFETMLLVQAIFSRQPSIIML